MKEIIRQYGGTAVAVLVVILMLLVTGNSAQYVRDSASAGKLGRYGKVLVPVYSSVTFDQYWSGR